MRAPWDEPKAFAAGEEDQAAAMVPFLIFMGFFARAWVYG
jgi:hypothetical protein